MPRRAALLSSMALELAPSRRMGLAAAAAAGMAAPAAPATAETPGASRTA
jgi:hypothetical protein